MHVFIRGAGASIPYGFASGHHQHEKRTERRVEAAVEHDPRHRLGRLRETQHLPWASASAYWLAWDGKPTLGSGEKIYCYPTVNVQTSGQVAGTA